MKCEDCKKRCDCVSRSIVFRAVLCPWCIAARALRLPERRTERIPA